MYSRTDRAASWQPWTMARAQAAKSRLVSARKLCVTTPSAVPTLTANWQPQCCCWRLEFEPSPLELLLYLDEVETSLVKRRKWCCRSVGDQIKHIDEKCTIMNRKWEWINDYSQEGITRVKMMRSWEISEDIFFKEIYRDLQAWSFEIAKDLCRSNKILKDLFIFQRIYLDLLRSFPI